MSIKGRDVRRQARALMKRFGRFDQIFAASPDALMRVDGVGKQTVENIKIIHDAFTRISASILNKTPVYMAHETLETYCRTVLDTKRVEEFHVIYLDAEHKVILDELHNTGTVDYSDIHELEILYSALGCGAKSVCLYHNHPRGTMNFSRDDKLTTQLVRDTLKVAKIALYDHLLVAAGTTLSMRNEHMLDDNFIM